MHEPNHARARPGSVGQRRANLVAGLEQFVDGAVFHRAVAVAHGLFTACNGSLDGFEVLRGKRHISVSSGNRWWSCGVEGVQRVAVGRQVQQVAVRVATDAPQLVPVPVFRQRRRARPARA